jgi:N utilization substance protein B
MSRRRARELALRAFYAFEFSGNPVETIVEEMIQSARLEDRIKEFARQLFETAAKNKKECDKYIITKAQNWDFERIAIIDKLIMRLAICEFLYFADIPPKVTMDEAIEIAKKYSTEKSGHFINGILDSVLLDLKQENLIKKSGRGLE